ncbi:hypothetical protein QBC34DRAFT_442299 [Podospora aff. communis PSN243]|uniref:Uncharacterized protein n=1 Tax=Podospora aff. communis PSN243 TaxID=3040156 RepID=A0AAV9G9X5_9PEZI|nr:hypothetical protein QBC34DRAFT_442299 [Podospora aff. communis PSN243]
MAVREMETYFGYSEPGHDVDRLRIGSLVFDYANPRTKRPHYGHHEVDELLNDPSIAEKVEYDECSMTLRTNKSSSFGFGLGELLDLEHSREREMYRHVMGPSGLRVELKDAPKFFQENILAEGSKARLWLETRLSAPSVWLLTGVHLIDNAVAYTVSSKQLSNAASAAVPIPDPTLIAEMLGASVGARFSVGRGFDLEATSQVRGRRIWRAQWTRVSVKYFTVRATAAGPQPQRLGNQFGLLDVEDIGSVRSNEIHMAEVGVVDASKDEGEIQDVEVELDDEQWAEFERILDQLLEDLGEDDAGSS